MKRTFLEVLACPCCLGDLQLEEIRSDQQNIICGNLYCSNCQIQFDIQEDIPVFGLRYDDKEERINEIKAENEWTFSANDIQAHKNFAEISSKNGYKLIEHIESFDTRSQQRNNVLDIGSGWGCFQAWQFAKRGYNVTAAELCPEFIFASDKIAEDCYFERIITDCTVLPFKDQSYDIIFCKETLHHIDHPVKLLDEMWRVCSPGGLIVIKEPCTSPLLKLFINRINRAGKIGITHHFCTPKSYITLMKNITQYNIIYYESFIEHSHSIKYIPLLKSPANNLATTILGCNLEILGVKRLEYKPELSANRKVTPINLNELNAEMTKFYRDKLIPNAFKYYH